MGSGTVLQMRSCSCRDRFCGLVPKLRNAAAMNTPEAPGWYADPSSKPGKLYWDGKEWHTAIPAAHQHGGSKLVKVVAIAGMALAAMGGLGAIGGALWSAARNDSGSTRPRSADPNTLAPTTTRTFVSEKSMPTDGIYLVGGDQVDPGVWASAGPTDSSSRPCTWARLSAAQQPSAENTIETGGSDSGPTQVRILPGDAAFSTQGCQPWHLAGK